MGWQVSEPEEVEEILDYRFSDRTTLSQALTHSSIRGPDTPCNERMEFLGDSILGCVIAEHLHETLTDHQEGELTLIKSAVVSRDTIGRVCRAMGLRRHLGLGKGIANRKRLPPSIFANVYESIIAAIRLDGGMEEARRFVLRTLDPEIQLISRLEFRWNFKSRLQDYAQKRFACPPRYQVLAEDGPDHDKSFQVEALVDGKSYPAAWGHTKKEAQQKAARHALEMMLEAEGTPEDFPDDNE